MHLVLLLCGLLAVNASAALIEVYPGAGTPLQDAIDGASPGDTLRLHNGTYPENISIDKALRLRGINNNLGYPSAAIVGDCVSNSAIAVNADDVAMSYLSVNGGALYAIDITGRNGVVVRKTHVSDICGGGHGGVNVFQSTRVRLSGNVVRDQADTGIRIGGTPIDGKVLAIKNRIHFNTIGILVDASPLGSNVSVRSNAVQQNTDGIVLDDAHGARIVRNEVVVNSNNGIWATATSTKNGIFRNIIRDSGNLDVVDNSNDNCWLGNTFGTGTPNTNGC